MTDWKDIHPDFTKKLQKRWKSFGFDHDQVKMWIDDYGFSPCDADFAIYIGDNDFIISEMTKEELAELRGKYNEAVKNKEIDFPFEESEEEEEENIALNRRDWRNIRSDFTPELVQQWQECGFNYEEVQDKYRDEDWRYWILCLTERCKKGKRRMGFKSRKCWTVAKRTSTVLFANNSASSDASYII